MQEIRRRGLKVAVVGIPKTIDNDIVVLVPYTCCLAQFVETCSAPSIVYHLVVNVI